MSAWVEKNAAILFAALGAVVLLWQMLLPGYVLTWDMIFGPSSVFLMPSGLLNGLPLTFLLYGAGLVIPMWLVQKVVLIALAFSLFYLPLRFFPFKIESWARYAGAALFAVNPFVYERLLAGQWGVLAGYALLMPFVFYLLELLRAPRFRSAARLAAVMLLIGVFSLHTFVMAVLVATVFILFILAYRFVKVGAAEALALGKQAALAGAIVLLFSSYWLVPYFLEPAASPLPKFGEAHWEAFETSIDTVVFGNATGNVLMLYGFWGESYPWLQSLASPKDAPWVFVPSLLLILGLVCAGVIFRLRCLGAKDSRGAALALLALGAAAFVFSVGLAPSYFQGVNVWLFEHVPFWGGFRDTQKWSMWLALVYAVFFAAGAAWTVAKVARVAPALRSFSVAVLILLPFVYTSTLAFGLAGQVQPVFYPETWHEVNDILAEDLPAPGRAGGQAGPNCKALFLPWHQYYWLAFNGGVLTVNPASRFFDCEILSSKNAGIGEIGDQGNTDPVYERIDAAVTTNDPTTIDATLEVLRDADIHYIIFTPDLLGLDDFSYPFLAHPALELLYDESADGQGIALYRL